MAKLRLASDLLVPEEAVTSTFVVYGGKGMGKTNFGSVFVEELTKARLRWAVLDPMGVWWGLRHSKDGTAPGIECVILGGAHGDIPIEPTGGAIVADLVVDENANVIIDFSRRANGQMWTIGEKVRFVTEYTLRLFQRQGELVDKRRREPMMQILDESARYIPQTIPSGNIDLARCVGAWEQVCEEGRNIGLGVAFLTQRSARMNKSVSELADVMVAFRTIGPNSLAAIMDWLGEHVDKARSKELSARVRELNVGQALVVSPGWLRIEKVVDIRQRETFDSSATPKPGQRAQKVSGAAAKPDLAKYETKMAATIEKAKADDPKALRARIAVLEAQSKKALGAEPSEAQLSEARRIGFNDARAHLDASLTFLNDQARVLRNAVTLIESYVNSYPSGPVLTGMHVPFVTVSVNGSGQRPPAPAPTCGKCQTPGCAWCFPKKRAVTPSPASATGSTSLPKGERTCLIAIAQHDDGVQRDQLSILSGYKRSTRDAYVQRLSEKGFVEIRGMLLLATSAGVAALGTDYEPLPTGTALQAYWLDRLPEGEGRVLRVLLDGETVSREQISEVTGYKRSTRDAYIQRLGTRRLVTTDRDGVRASVALFDE